MRKNQCMHCAEPGCLEACPSDGAIVQYTNGIVDFQQANCIGCGYCITGCPFNIPKFNPETKRVYKCTLCADRVSEGLEPACIKSCPTGCLHFGTKDDMQELADTRAKQLRDHYNFPNAGVYDPQGVGGTGVMYVLHDATQPELYGGLPKDPHIPWTVKLWKGPLKWLGNAAMIGGLIGLFVHYLRFGPKSREARRSRSPCTEGGTTTVSHQEQLLPHGHILRYTFRERLVHWVAGFSYLYLLLTGLAFWSPWLFWLAVVVGGAPVSRMLHPWIGLIFFFGIVQMYLMWSSQMHITDVDRAWFRSMSHYIRNEDELMPPAGRYNAGQKLLFWGFIICGTLVLLSGVVLWFPEYIPWNLRWLRYIAFILHASSRAAHHWPLPDPCLYGRFRRARRVWFGHPRRCHRRICEEIPSGMV